MTSLFYFIRKIFRKMPRRAFGDRNTTIFISPPPILSSQQIKSPAEKADANDQPPEPEWHDQGHEHNRPDGGKNVAAPPGLEITGPFHRKCRLSIL